MFFIIDHAAKVVVGWSPKCGCTHVKHLLRFFMTGRTDHENLHHVLPCLLPTDLRAYAVVIVARNPFDRLVSGFLDKYKKGEALRARFPTITFAQLVECVVQRRFDIIDYDHFAPQTEAQFDPRVFQAKSCKIFDLNSIDYEYLEHLFGKRLPLSVLQYKGGHTRQAYTEEWKTPVYNLNIDTYIHYKVNPGLFYSPALRAKVYAFFKRDFDLLSARRTFRMFL